MREMFKELLSSKKFITTAVAIIVWVVGRFGLHVDEASLLPLVGALSAFVIAQGFADHGKEAEKAKAKLGTGDSTVQQVNLIEDRHPTDPNLIR